MMRRSVAILSLGLLALPVSAEAQTCGGSSFKTCASVVVSALGIPLTGGTRVTMTVMNNSGFNGTFASTVFGAFGIFGLPNYSWSNFSFMGAGNWAFGTQGLSGAPIIQRVAGGKFSGQGGVQQNGLQAGQSVTFTFDLNVGVGSVDPTDWAIHGQSGPNGCSTKLVSTNGVANDGPYDAANCGVDLATGLVTPEPASMILLGTGLAGIAAVRRRRRES